MVKTKLKILYINLYLQHKQNLIYLGASLIVRKSQINFQKFRQTIQLFTLRNDDVKLHNLDITVLRLDQTETPAYQVKLQRKFLFFNFSFRHKVNGLENFKQAQHTLSQFVLTFFFFFAFY